MHVFKPEIALLQFVGYPGGGRTAEGNGRARAGSDIPGFCTSNRPVIVLEKEPFSPE
jgi:hypothetical protein